jgi:hypothetical protein
MEGSMNRRDFVGASLGASLWPMRAQAERPDDGTQAAARSAPALLELRRYRLRYGPMEARFAEYAKGVLVPAMSRAGVKPVGAFTVLVGPESPSVYLLLQHPGAESVAALAGRLGADAEYKRAAAPFRGLTAADPLYVRRGSSLMVAFDSMPGVSVPAGPLAAPSRVFELRSYESHSEAAHLKKVEMFEGGGETAIFRRVGLAPVFFGRDLISPFVPCLTYMVVFPDLAGRENAWNVFREDPEWVKLRATPGYTNAEIVTNIQSVLLRPTDYSQI